MNSEACLIVLASSIIKAKKQSETFDFSMKGSVKLIWAYFSED